MLRRKIFWLIYESGKVAEPRNIEISQFMNSTKKNMHLLSENLLVKGGLGNEDLE
jgi:hypothetical protein